MITKFHHYLPIQSDVVHAYRVYSGAPLVSLIVVIWKQ